MKNFKFTPKIALIIILGLITIVGIYLYLRSGTVNNQDKTAGEKGFLSFFGERKIKPSDETTVPGVSTAGGTGTGSTGGTITAGVTTTGSGSTGGTTGGGTGSLSLRPIGTNINNVGENTSFGTGFGGTSSGVGTTGGTGGVGTSGQTTGGTTGGGTGSTTGGTGPLPQLNCTPKQIEFTEEETKKLKALEERFYKVAAEIRTQEDVDTLVRTRQNYYSYLSSDYSATSKKDGTGVVELTKQCYAERQKVKDAKSSADPFFGKPLGMRPNPFITTSMFATLANVPPLKTYLNTERLAMATELKDLSKMIDDTEAKVEDREQQLNAKRAELNFAQSSQDYSAASRIQSEMAVLEASLTSNSSQLPKMKLRAERLNALLDQVTNDPFSYFANSTTYVENEPYSEKETEKSRKNNVYQNMQGIFYDVFGWGDITDKLWGGGKAEWNLAPDSNPLKKSGFAEPCDQEPGVRKTTIDGKLVCFEKYYPMQDLERVLGIW